MRAGRWATPLAVLALVVPALAATAGCAIPMAGSALPAAAVRATTAPAAAPAGTATGPMPAATAPPATTAVAETTAPLRPPAECPLPDSGFDCDFQRRFVAASDYVRQRPGLTGIVVRDRHTGAAWRNDGSGRPVWTASTVKLGMAVDLLLRDRAGAVALTAEDRALIRAMLHSSDDAAADTLWGRYGRDGYATRFPDYGLTSITFVPGFPRYWGFMKCTPEDLDRLVNYVLAGLPADLRDFIVGELRAVAANQQWGVWGAGPAARPGTKNGWSLEDTGWVMNTVGFAGPGGRYTLAVMNDLRGQGGYEQGKVTDTEVARLIFTGRF